MKITVTIEDDGEKETKVVFGHSEQDMQTFKAMPILIALKGFVMHWDTLAQRLISKAYPNIKRFSKDGQEQQIKEYHNTATFYNLQFPATYKREDGQQPPPLIIVK